MKIEINTKYAIGDELYAFDDGLNKFRVDDIVVPCGSVRYGDWEVAYECTLISKGELEYSARFRECELYTKEELSIILQVVTSKNTDTDVNVADKLRGKPRETKLYSPMYGDIWLADVEGEGDDAIITCYVRKLEDGCVRADLFQEDTVSFWANGKTSNADCSVTDRCMLYLDDRCVW